jgi:hypothetical protein
MKKVGVLFLLLCLIAGGNLFGQEFSQFYDLVVPYQFDTLSVAGSFGGDSALRMELDTTTSPAGFTFDLGGQGDYAYYDVTSDQVLLIDASGDIRFGTTQFWINPDAGLSYTSHTLELSGLSAFWGAGGDIGFTFNRLSSGFNSTSLNINPYGEFGIGRMHSVITSVKEALLTMEKLGITPTDESVRSAAEIIRTRGIRLAAYGENTADNYRDYYNDLAAAIGYTGDILNLAFIDKSQEFLFEIARTNQMRYGWEARARLEPGFTFNRTGAVNTSTFDIDLVLGGAYADFTMDDMLYYYGSASITPGYSSAFLFSFNLRGEVSYLPDNPRWYVTGWSELDFNKDNTPKADFTMGARGNYMIAPNFTTFAGLNVTTNFRTITLNAGGRYRIW